MKKKCVLFGTLLAGMLSACSDSEELTGGNVGGNVGGATGDSYVSLAINLPTEASKGMRAANDQFDDGLVREYAVNDATLVLFEGQDQTSATFSGAYDLNLNWQMNGNENITTSAKIVQQVRSLSDENNKYYAFVILNKGGVVSLTKVVPPLTDDTKIEEYLLSVNGSFVDKNTTFADFAKSVNETEASFSTNPYAQSGLFMCNAPLLDVPGGSSEPSGDILWMPEIDKNKIFSTREAAEANPATNVNVERAVAKVTVCQALSGEAALTGPAEKDAKLTYQILGWTLDCTNKTSYLVRNLGGFTSNPAWLGYKSDASGSSYRFAGTTQVGDEALYRIYWAEDPNYNTVFDAYNFAFNFIGEGKALEESAVQDLGGENPLYCLENTFNVEHQNDRETTRAVVAVKFNGESGDFYTLNGEATSNTLYDGTGIETAVLGVFLNIPEVADYVKGIVTSGQTLSAADFEVTLSKRQEGAATLPGEVSVEGVTFKSESASKLVEGIDVRTVNGKITADFLAKVQAGAKIQYYKDGIAYYPVRIKHFGDDLTPWNTWETVKPSASVIYPGQGDAPERNYLGRYGVVRNNWYEINVNSIKYLGSPTVPDFSATDKDDTLESYIAVTINILSWAKRVQNEDL